MRTSTANPMRSIAVLGVIPLFAGASVTFEAKGEGPEPGDILSLLFIFKGRAVSLAKPGLDAGSVLSIELPVGGSCVASVSFTDNVRTRVPLNPPLRDGSPSPSRRRI